MRRVSSLLRALICGLALTGCGIVTIVPAGQGRSNRGGRAEAPRTNMAVDTDRRVYPKSMALLDDSEAALAQNAFDKALDLARQSQPAREGEYEASTKDVVYSEAGERVRVRATLFEGLALRGLGKDMEALLAIGRSSLDTELCKSGLKPRCDEHAAFLTAAYPNLLTGFGSLHLKAIDTLSPGLNTLLMNVNEREILPKKGWVGLIIEPTSKKGGPNDTVILRIDGETTHDTLDDCNKIGTARIGGTDFDVERCHKEGYTAPRANFIVEVPASDVTAMTGAKGERVFVVFETKNWKKSGNLYNAGAGRVAWIAQASR